MQVLRHLFNDFFKDVWNVPNVLTMLRMALIPVYLVVYYNSSRFIALIIFIVASLTDLLDGYLARKNNQITNFGKLMDPVADKLMVICVMFTQTLSGIVPWAVLITVAVKELFMIIGGYLLLLREGVVSYAKIWGKIAQFSFVIGLALSFFHDYFAAWGFPVDQIVLWISLGLTLWALGHYIASAAQQMRAKNQIVE